MTQITVTTRGNEVAFEATFSVPSVPEAASTAAKLRVVYPQENATNGEFEADMEAQDDGSWIAYWDTTEAFCGGRVFWWVSSTAGIIAAEEGSFLLKANPANHE